MQGLHKSVTPFDRRQHFPEFGPNQDGFQREEYPNGGGERA